MNDLTDTTDSGGIVRLGLRFEIVDEYDRIVGTISREDVLGAAVPRVGEQLARGTLNDQLASIVRLDPIVRGVQHYVHIPGHVVPGSVDSTPLAMVILRATSTKAAVAALQSTFEHLGWHMWFPTDHSE